MEAKDIEQYCCEVYGFDCATDRGQGFVDGATWADKISFKAGIHESDKKWRQILGDSVAVAKLAGIREVVEKLERWHGAGEHLISDETIKALKDWEVKNA